MAHHDASHGLLDEKDPCGSWGKDQKWAVIWFVSVIVFGTVLTCTLARIDSWMYHNDDTVEIAGVKLIDNEKFRDNRKATFGIASERSDLRARGSYSHAVNELD